MKVLEEELLCLSDVQDNKRYDVFYKAFATDSYFFNYMRQIFSSNLQLNNKRRAIANLAWLINCEFSGQHFGEKVNFSPTQIQNKFQKFMYRWGRLSWKNIPFEEWSDLAEEGLQVLEYLVDSNKLEHFEGDSRYLDFMKKFVQRHEDLRMNKGYEQLNEVMDS